MEQKINDSKHHIRSLSLNVRFSGKKSQNQQKLAKKISYLTIQFHSENFAYFTNLNSLNIAKSILPRHILKPYSRYKFSKKNVFCWSQKKKDLHWTISKSPRTTFSKHLEGKCLCIIVCFLKKFLFQRRRKLLSGGEMNNFIQATRCLGLAECLKTFYSSIEIFGNSTNFHHFDTSINNNDMLKFFRQFWLQGKNYG